MNLDILHTLSGILALVAIIVKVIIHYRLDHLHGRNTSLSQLGITPIKYLSKYTGEVDEEHASLKNICNLMLLLAAIFLLVNFILGLIIYFSTGDELVKKVANPS